MTVYTILLIAQFTCYVLHFYSAPVGGAEYCDQPLCLSEHIFGTAGPIFTKFCVQISCAVARSSSGGVALRYVLPVLLMMSHLAVMGARAGKGWQH